MLITEYGLKPSIYIANTLLACCCCATDNYVIHTELLEVKEDGDIGLFITSVPKF